MRALGWRGWLAAPALGRGSATSHGGCTDQRRRTGEPGGDGVHEGRGRRWARRSKGGAWWWRRRGGGLGAVARAVGGWAALWCGGREVKGRAGVARGKSGERGGAAWRGGVARLSGVAFIHRQDGRLAELFETFLLYRRGRGRGGVGAGIEPFLVYRGGGGHCTEASGGGARILVRGNSSQASKAR
jgi:hypothetical protein